MRKFALAACFTLALVPAVHAEDAQPAGYIIAADLRGADRDAGTAVIHAGMELKPKIWMPLYAGDVVFVRDASSQVTLDMGEGGRVEIGGGLSRYEAKGEIATDEDAWSVISKIGSILAGGGESMVPENLASKGDGALIALTASNGPNMVIAGNQPLVLAWKGGTAPFEISLRVGKDERKITQTNETHVELALPTDAGKGFDAVITDAKGMTKRIPFRLREALPEAPPSLARAGPSEDFDAVLLAGWLAERPKGAWRLEALRRLQPLKEKNEAAAMLFKAMTAGS